MPFPNCLLSLFVPTLSDTYYILTHQFMFGHKTAMPSITATAKLARTSPCDPLLMVAPFCSPGVPVMLGLLAAVILPCIPAGTIVKLVTVLWLPFGNVVVKITLEVVDEEGFVVAGFDAEEDEVEARADVEVEVVVEVLALAAEVVVVVFVVPAEV